MTPAHSRRTAAWIPVRGSVRTRPSTSAAARLRPLARRVHFLAGLLVAPFLLVLCLTGLAYVFTPQIHDDLYSRQLFVDQVGAARQPLANQVAAALTAHPEARVQSVVPPAAPNRTTRVNLQAPGLDDPREARTVFVDPYTGFISGELITTDGRLPANVWLRGLHADLHLGEIGRLYSEVAASWVPVIVVGGLVVWVGKQGRRRRTAAELLVPAPRGKGEMTRLRSVHGPLGIWLTGGLLVLSVTGLVMSPLAGWGLPDVRQPTLAAAPVDAAPVDAAPVDAAPVDVAPRAPIGIDGVLAVAVADGLAGELVVTPPAAADRPFTVVETAKGLPIRKGAIAVDPYTAQVTERVGWSDYPLLAQVREIGVQIHTGSLFGLANQILLTLVVLGTIALIVGGYRMWWKRNPFRESVPTGPTPALAALSVPVVLGVATVAAVLGWLLPLFGISLLGFLLLDVLVRAVRNGGERGRRTVAAGALVLAAAALIGFAVLPGPAPTAGQAVGAGPAPGPGAPAGGIEPGPWSGGTAPNGAFGFGLAPAGPPRVATAPGSALRNAVPDVRTTAAAPVAGAPAPASPPMPAPASAASASASDDAAVAAVDPTRDPQPTVSPSATPGGPAAGRAPVPPAAAPAGSPGLVENVVGLLTGVLMPVTGDLAGVTGQLLRR